MLLLLLFSTAFPAPAQTQAPGPNAQEPNTQEPNTQELEQRAEEDALAASPFFSRARASQLIRLISPSLHAATFAPSETSPQARATLGLLEGRDIAPPASGWHMARVFGPARSRDFWFEEPPAKQVVFAALDATERELYFGNGVKRALRGHLDEPGFRIMATFGAKIREFDPVLGTHQSRLHSGRLVAGHEWKFATLNVTVLAGGSFVLHSADIAQQSRRLGRLGPVVMLELWQDWGAGAAPGSRFTSLFAMADQASRSSYLRLRHGFGLGGNPVRFGPEASIATGESLFRRGVRLQSGWRKARLGAHLGEVPLWRAVLGVSAGVEARAARKPGGYLGLSAYLRY